MITKTSIMSGKLYLHHEPHQLAAHVIISSHGGFDDATNLTFNVDKNCRKGTQIHFYDVHTKTLSMGMGQSVPGKAPIYETVSIERVNQEVYNYRLTKFQGRHNQGHENYGTISKEIELSRDAARFAPQQDHIRELREKKRTAAEERSYARCVQDLEGFDAGNKPDVVTIRNRYFNNVLFLKDVINALQRHNPRYLNIYCSFCRGVKDGRLDNFGF